MSFSNYQKKMSQLRSQTSLSKLHSLRYLPTAMPREQREGLPVLNLSGTGYPTQAKAGSALALKEFLGSLRQPMSDENNNGKRSEMPQGKSRGLGWCRTQELRSGVVQHRGLRLNQVQAFKHQMPLESKVGFGSTGSKQSFSWQTKRDLCLFNLGLFFFSIFTWGGGV